MLLMLFAVLIGGSGFVYKLIQFSKEALTSEVASFAVVPVIVYVLVAMGFGCMFFWAMFRGHLSDLEGPKYRLLEEERRHDAEGE
jgi:nitrogen fixation-related uncharacterized protein